MARSVTTHLMFGGQAEPAIRLYATLFKDSNVKTIEHYGPDEAGHEGSVKLAIFTIAGREFMAIDSPVKHEFTFTPAMSIFVDCENQAELAAAFETLSHDGNVLMPPGDYGFSQQFAWITDRFGVSWQLNLPAK